MLLYLDDRKASKLLTILNHYKRDPLIEEIYAQVKEGLEIDYGKMVD